MASHPSHRHDSAESTKHHTAIYDIQTPWTAARCQRLLRPLSSKIALLRKEVQCNANAEEAELAHKSPNGPTLKYRGRVYDQGTRRRASDAVDMANEEWAPNPRPRKKLKRTYTSKSLNSQLSGPTSLPGGGQGSSQGSAGITIPNNLFQPNAHPDAKLEAAEPTQDTDLDRRGRPCESRVHSRHSGEHLGFLWAHPPRSNYNVKLPFQRRLADGIAKGLEALLWTTGKPEVSQVSGARGLFATCLRRVPDLIAQEELLYEMEDPENNVDVSFTIYSELESLSTSKVGGWRPLRQIVRAHGVSMVGSAICEGLFEPNVTRGIVATCCRLGAYNAAQHILQCLIQTLEPSHKPSRIAPGTIAILQALDEFVLATGRHSVRYRQLTWLLSSGKLPLEWIGRPEMIDAWNRVVQSITQQDDDAGPAAHLLRLVTCMTYGICHPCPATLVQGIRLQRQGLAKKANEYIVRLGYQTRWPRGSKVALPSGEGEVHYEKASSSISSLMTVFCAIGLLRSARAVCHPSQLCLSGVAALQDIAVDAQQAFELASDRVLSIKPDRIGLPLLAAGLVQATVCRNRNEFAATVPAFFDRLSSLSDAESRVDEGGAFLCAVADCCARATGGEVFDHIQKVVQHVRQIAESLKPLAESHKLCNRLGLAAALEYAGTTNQPKHLHWALDVEQAITGAHLGSARRTPAKTPLRGQAQARNGYRWEAGICEWVAKTPAISLVRPSIPGQRAASTEAFVETPSRIQRGEGGDRIVSSPCATNGQGRTTFVKRSSRRMERARMMKSEDVAAAAKAVESLPKKVFFSHVYVTDDADELSMCESPPDSQMKLSNRLQEIKNLASKFDQQHCAQGSDTTCTETDIEVDQMTLESEDELSLF